MAKKKEILSVVSYINTLIGETRVAAGLEVCYMKDIFYLFSK